MCGLCYLLTIHFNLSSDAHRSHYGNALHALPEQIPHNFRDEDEVHIECQVGPQPNIPLVSLQGVVLEEGLSLLHHEILVDGPQFGSS